MAAEAQEALQKGRSFPSETPQYEATSVGRIAEHTGVESRDQAWISSAIDILPLMPHTCSLTTQAGGILVNGGAQFLLHLMLMTTASWPQVQAIPG